MNKSIIIAIVVVIVIVLAGLYMFTQTGNKTQTSNTNTNPITKETGLNISIENFAFSPADLKIKVGDTVTWTNNDGMQHTIKETGFESQALSRGESYSHTFSSAGSYSYYCGIHPNMKGRIVVE